MVRPEVFQAVVEILGMNPAIDAFALRGNLQVQDYWGPDSEVSDAFGVSWEASRCGLLWANPPFSELSRVLCKARADVAHIIFCAPEWSSQNWFSELQSMAVKIVRVESGNPVFTFLGQTVGNTKWGVDFALLCGHELKCSWYQMWWMSLSRAQKRKERRRRTREKWRCRGDGGSWQ